MLFSSLKYLIKTDAVTPLVNVESQDIGMGILIIVNDIVKAHGGTIKVESYSPPGGEIKVQSMEKQGQSGTEFIITLPFNNE